MWKTQKTYDFQIIIVFVWIKVKSQIMLQTIWWSKTARVQTICDWCLCRFAKSDQWDLGFSSLVYMWMKSL